MKDYCQFFIYMVRAIEIVLVENLLKPWLTRNLNGGRGREGRGLGDFVIKKKKKKNYNYVKQRVLIRRRKNRVSRNTCYNYTEFGLKLISLSRRSKRRFSGPLPLPRLISSTIHHSTSVDLVDDVTHLGSSLCGSDWRRITLPISLWLSSRRKIGEVCCGGFPRRGKSATSVAVALGNEESLRLSLSPWLWSKQNHAASLLSRCL